MTDYRDVPSLITLARGILRIRKEGESSWQDLMHVKDVKINVASEEVAHENVRSKLKVVDKKITTKMEANGSFICDVPLAENIALFLMGNGASEVSQVSGSWTTQEFTVVKPGEAQELGKYDITVTTITDDTGTPVPLVEGVDYLADWKRGLFTPLVGSTMVGMAGDKFKITGTYSAFSKKQVKAGKEPIKRHVWFAGDPATGRIQDIRGYCNLKPNGDLPLITDEWQGFSFDISFNAHTSYDSPVGLIYEDLGAAV